MQVAPDPWEVDRPSEAVDIPVSVNRNVDIRRRSPRVADVFAQAVDELGLLDWRALRAVPAGTTMLALLRRPGG